MQERHLPQSNTAVVTGTSQDGRVRGKLNCHCLRRHKFARHQRGKRENMSTLGNSISGKPAPLGPPVYHATTTLSHTGQLIELDQIAIVPHSYCAQLLCTAIAPCPTGVVGDLAAPAVGKLSGQAQWASSVGKLSGQAQWASSVVGELSGQAQWSASCGCG
jgi:hypothetical protein